MRYSILLNDIDSVKKFSYKATCVDFEVDVISGKYIVDGKSIMGLFSLNLSHPVEIKLSNGSESEYTAFIEALATIGITTTKM